MMMGYFRRVLDRGRKEQPDSMDKIFSYAVCGFFWTLGPWALAGGGPLLLMKWNFFRTSMVNERENIRVALALNRGDEEENEGRPIYNRRAAARAIQPVQHDRPNALAFILSHLLSLSLGAAAGFVHAQTFHEDTKKVVVKSALLSFLLSFVPGALNLTFYQLNLPFVKYTYKTVHHNGSSWKFTPDFSLPQLSKMKWCNIDNEFISNFPISEKVIDGMKRMKRKLE